MTADEELTCVYETKTFMEGVFSEFHHYPDMILYKALVLLQKFFRKFSIRQLKSDKCLLGTACIFLAAKLDDCPIKLVDIATLYHKHELAKNRLPARPLSDQRKFQIENEICKLESDILREIGFDLEIELPYKYILQYQAYPTPNMAKILEVAQRFCNDSFLKPLCLYYHPLQVACCCIYFATLFWKTPLPDHNGLPWYKFLNSGIELEHIKGGCAVLKNIYATLEAKNAAQKKAAETAHPTGGAKTGAQPAPAATQSGK